MLRLRNRNAPIPNGNQFYDPVLQYRARPNMSFQGICEGLRIARLANPGLTKARKLATEPKQIEAEVDLYLATVCKSMGWNDFILEGDGGSPAPFPQGRNRPPVTSRQQVQQRSSLGQKLSNVAAGSEVIIDWIASGAEAVPQEQANNRAEVCSKCPLNGKGGWETWFTVPASNAIRAALLKKEGMKLSTPFDAELGVCEACSCPMKLKVWIKFAEFFPKMTQEAKDALDKGCWIRSEVAA